MIYQTNPNNRARFILGEMGSRPLVYVGLNPSTASPEKLDATTTRAKRFSERLGYEGWLMINLYAQRATLPKNLHKRKSSVLDQQNMAAIEQLFKTLGQPPQLLATWGDLLFHRPYLLACRNSIAQLANKYQAEWYHLGSLTKQQQPRHISRLAYAVPFLSYNFQ